MLAEVVAALDGQALVLPALAPLADTLAAIEAAMADMILLLAGADLSAVDRAMLLAAIGPLAVARAPLRVCALDIAAGATVADVVAAAQFLAGAASTTGQVLAIGH
ncbi:Rossmann fold domain-containing protein [Sphingomonas sp. PB4P5]|uniref:Rossmann fold domain-containing protein n=1 Tax=Parasphingomonas puruogangriensis TaxID=3096155 RepID=UPI002FCA5886